MILPKFRGVIVPFITPFKEDLGIDFEAAKWLASYQCEHGVDGIFPYSTTGEFVHLRPEEGIELVKAVMEAVKGGVMIIPGISSNSTERSIELGRAMKDLGVDGVVITPPFFFKVGGARLKLHFSRVAEKVDLPIIVYNIPAATGINLPVELYVELSKEYENVAGAKVTYDSVAYMRRLIREVKAVRKDFSVLTGLDDHLLLTLMMGGDGGIMALANVAPQIHVAVYRAWLEGDLKRAYDAFKRLLKLAGIYDVSTSFPTAVKAALKAINAPVKPYVRMPLTPEEPEVEERIEAIVDELGLKLT